MAPSQRVWFADAKTPWLNSFSTVISTCRLVLMENCTSYGNIHGHNYISPLHLGRLNVGRFDGSTVSTTLEEFGENIYIPFTATRSNGVPGKCVIPSKPYTYYLPEDNSLTAPLALADL